MSALAQLLADCDAQGLRLLPAADVNWASEGTAGEPTEESELKAFGPGGWPIDCIEPPDPRPNCGSLELWWNSFGGQHCTKCTPFSPVASRLRRAADRHKRRAMPETGTYRVKRSQPAHLVGSGRLDQACGTCGGVEFYEVEIHGGESARRDCAFCDGFVAFIKWNGRNQNAPQAEHNVQGDAAQSFDISPMQFDNSRPQNRTSVDEFLTSERISPQSIS